MRKPEMKKENEPKAASTVPVPKMKRGVRGFFRDVGREMRHVTWPGNKETTRLTGVVITVCVAIIIFLFLLSRFFDTLFTIIFRGGA
jgi:preprotein translocase SecE subunit